MMKLVKDTKVYAKRRNGNKNRPGPFILFDLTEKLLRPLLLRFLFFVLFTTATYSSTKSSGTNGALFAILVVSASLLSHAVPISHSWPSTCACGGDW